MKIAVFFSLESEYDNDNTGQRRFNWKSKRSITLQELASSPDSLKYVFDNHPVVKSLGMK